MASKGEPSPQPSPLSTGEREKGVAFMSAGMFALLKTLWMLLVIVGCIHDISLYYMWNIVRHAQYYAHTPSAARAAEMMPTLERVVRTHAGPVFVPHAFLANMSRQPPIVLDVVHYRLMVDGGIISADELVGRLTRREFALIILRERLEPHFNANSFTRWPEAVWSAMLQNYEYLGDVDGQSVYATKVE